MDSVYTEKFSGGFMLCNNKISWRSGKFQSGEYQNRGKNARFSLVRYDAGKQKKHVHRI